MLGMPAGDMRGYQGIVKFKVHVTWPFAGYHSNTNARVGEQPTLCMVEQ